MEVSSRHAYRKPLLVSALLTPVALFVAFMSAGYGHGDYILARMILPYACIAVRFTWRHMMLNQLLVIGLAIIQFPIYAALYARGAQRGRSRKYLLGISGVHTLSVVTLFTVFRESFS